MTKLSDYFVIDERQREAGKKHYGEGYIGSYSMSKAEFDAVRTALHNAGINFLISEPKPSTPRDSSAWFVGVSEIKLVNHLDKEVTLGRASGRKPG